MTGAAGRPGEELAGHLGVEATARRVRRYRYAEERMMRMLAGWIALTPELPAKLLLGRHVWDCAQHADQWGKRLPELRAPAQVSEAPSAAFAAALDALESRDGWSETPERLGGVYRVLKPHLVAAYAAHLERANPVYETPTRRVLERCLADERRHIAEAAALLDRLLTSDAAARLGGWTDDLRRRLEAAGGLDGEAP